MVPAYLVPERRWRQRYGTHSGTRRGASLALAHAGFADLPPAFEWYFAKLTSDPYAAVSLDSAPIPTCLDRDAVEQLRLLNVSSSRCPVVRTWRPCCSTIARMHRSTCSIRPGSCAWSSSCRVLGPTLDVRVAQTEYGPGVNPQRRIEALGRRPASAVPLGEIRRPPSLKPSRLRIN